MANPFTTMAAVSTGAQVGGGLLQMFGQKQEGDAQAAQYRYRAAVSRINKQIAEQNSEVALTAGEQNSRRKGQEVGFQVGKQIVGQSSSGFDVNTGSNASVRDSTLRLGQEDQSMIREEFGRKAYGYRIKASTEQAEADAYEGAAKNAQSASKIKMLSTFLGTAGSVAGKWYQGAQSFGGASSSGITLYNPQQQASGWIA